MRKPNRENINYDGMTTTEIAEVLRLTRQSVDRILNRALDKMEKYIKLNYKKGELL